MFGVQGRAIYLVFLLFTVQFSDGETRLEKTVFPFSWGHRLPPLNIITHAGIESTSISDFWVPTGDRYRTDHNNSEYIILKVHPRTSLGDWKLDN